MIFSTIIGAGFASGKEVWYYFAQFGWISYPIILIMGLLFFVLCFVCLEFGKKFEISAVKQMNYILFNKMSFVAEVFLCLSNFVLLGIMFAGADSLFFESFGKGFYRFGGILTAFVSIFVVWLGFKKLVKVNMIIVPGMLFVVLAVICNCICSNSSLVIVGGANDNNIVLALLNSVSFIASNLYFAGFVIAKMGKGNTTKINAFASFFGTFFMLICILCMTTIIYFNPSSFVYDMPLVFIASKQNFVLGVIAKIIVWLGVATTAITLLYQIVNWLESYFGKHKIISILVCVMAVLFANIGFSAMINYFYPLLGVLGMVYAIFMSRRMAYPQLKTFKRQI